MDTALIHCDFFSNALELNTSMTVILPQLPGAGPNRKLPTLYLLHGLSDDHTMWQRRTSIERYVENLGLAVVMPAVHRSFYTDMAHGGKYWQFISQELPAVAQALFPLSGRREDNFVAGISMGGYGALKLGLSHPESFAAAASLSGAVDIVEVATNAEYDWHREMVSIFGDLDTLPGSDNDLYHLAEKAAQVKTPPRLYLCCGTEDFFHTQNRHFRDHARSLGLDLTYDEGPGEHEWGYWDRQIPKILAWLPIQTDFVA